MPRKSNEPRLEATIEEKFVNRMDDCGFINIKGDMAPEKNAGETDRIFFGHGPRTIVVEFKRLKMKKNRHARLQDHRREQFRKRGYEVYRVIGILEAEALFLQLTGRELLKKETRHEKKRRVRTVRGERGVDPQTED